MSLTAKALHSANTGNRETAPMSPLVITILIVSGIGVLLVIAYINHMVENNKLEKAR